VANDCLRSLSLLRLLLSFTSASPGRGASPSGYIQWIVGSHGPERCSIECFPLRYALRYRPPCGCRLLSCSGAPVSGVNASTCQAAGRIKSATGGRNVHGVPHHLGEESLHCAGL